MSCSESKRDNRSVMSVQDSIVYYIQRAGNETLPHNEKNKMNARALELAEKQPNDSLNFINYFFISFQYYNLGELEQYKETLQRAVYLAEKEKDSVNMARAYSYLGDYYHEFSINDSAFYYYYQAEKTYFKLNNDKNVGRVHMKKARVQFSERDYKGSEKSAVVALNHIRFEPDSHTEFEANNLLGLNCLSLKDYDKAQEYFNKALKLAREAELPGILQTETVCLSNLGLVYQKQERHDEAIRYFDLALNNLNLFDENPSLYADVLDNLTYSKFKLNRKNGVPEDFYKALKIRESHQNYNGIVENLIRLSEYYQSEKNTDSAVKYAVNAHDLARRTNILNLQLLTLRQLSTVIPEKSTEYSKEYIKLNDSLQNAERKVAERFARIEFETDEFKRQKERLAVQNRNILFFLVLISCIALLLYVIREQRSKNIQFRLKEAQQKANEEIYNLMLVRQQQLDEVVQKEKQRIARELHDGVLGRLFGTRINLDGLNNSDDEASKQSRENYINELKIIEQDIREISHELNRENLNIINNFVAILTNLLEEQKEVSQADLKYRIDSRIKWDKIDNNIKINVFRIIQEALQNINKYAEAKNIEIILNQEAETMMHLTISDDGVGFDTDRKAKGIGIKNMESRVKSCNGSFEIKSKKGKGTKISISLGF